MMQYTNVFIKYFANVILLFNSFFYISYVSSKRYDGHTLFRAHIKTDKDVEYLRTLSKRYEVNFWTEPMYRFMTRIDFSVSPRDKYLLMKEANKAGLTIYSMIDNIQSAFDQQSVKSYIRRQLESFDWDNYYNLSDIYEWIRDFASRDPISTLVYEIGKTYENRDILAVRMHLGEHTGDFRPKVIIEGGIHAREWIGPAVVTYIMYQIYNATKGNDELMKTIAIKYEWYFIPIANPDGYEYSHTKDRLWRKNRHGDGVDLNRNFDAEFRNEENSSVFDASYPGPRVFSELETKALSEFIRNHSWNLQHYYSFHSYGQYLIIPYAFTDRHLDNFDEVEKLSEIARKSMKSLYNADYSVGTTSDTIGYRAYGASTCWVKKTFRVPYVLSIELRDTGAYGFALPAAQIIPTGKEALVGLVSILNNSKSSPESLGEFSYEPHDDSLYNFRSGSNVHIRPMYFFIFVFLIIWNMFCS